MTTVLDVLQEEFAEFVARAQSIAQLSSFERPPRFKGDESQHIFRLAADFVGGDLHALSQVAAEARALGYVVVWERDHLHVQRFAAGFLARCGLFA